MINVNSEPQILDSAERPTIQEVREKSAWETPKMEDVSEQVMAQPYIRFT